MVRFAGYEWSHEYGSVLGYPGWDYERQEAIERWIDCFARILWVDSLRECVEHSARWPET